MKERIIGSNRNDIAETSMVLAHLGNSETWKLPAVEVFD